MRSPHASARDLAAVLGALSLVLVATAGALRLVDAVPGIIRGEPRGTRRLDSVADAERVLRAPLWLPAAAGPGVRRAPASLLVHRSPPRWVTVTFVDETGDAALMMLEMLDGARVLPSRALPRGRVLHVVPVSVSGADATLSRLVGQDGRLWHDVAWQRDGRGFVLRSWGPVEDLLRIASSTRRRER